MKEKLEIENSTKRPEELDLHKQGLQNWEKQHPLNFLGRSEKWLIAHSFVAIWFPVCSLYELVIISLVCITRGILISLGLVSIPFVVLTTWNGHTIRNLEKLVEVFWTSWDTVWTIMEPTSVLFRRTLYPVFLNCKCLECELKAEGHVQ